MIQIDRRQFLAFGGLGALGLALGPRLAFASSGGGGRDVLVSVFLRGGMDGLNVVAPYADADYRQLRPSLALPEPGGGEGSLLDLDGFFGLHPAAQPLLPLYDAGELAVVHATGAPHGTRSHFDAQAAMEAGRFDGPAFDGWINRHLAIVGEGATFQGVAFGQATPASMRGLADTLAMRSLDGFGVDVRSSFAAGIPDLLAGIHGGDSLLERSARSALAASAELAAADPAAIAPDPAAAYPEGDFGDGLRQVAQLVKAELGLVAASVDLGGWDTHEGQAGQLAGVLSTVASGLAALRIDLGGRFDRVVVVVMSEFGRRAFENGTGGTDHGSGNLMLVMGGGVLGGRVLSDWPGLSAASLVDGDLALTLDYREVLAEMLATRMGNPEIASVFPGFTSFAAPGLFAPG